MMNDEKKKAPVAGSEKGPSLFVIRHSSFSLRSAMLVALAVWLVCPPVSAAVPDEPYHGRDARATDGDATDGRPARPPVYGYEVVNVYPHDRAAFCQGLVFADGFLYEGTGMYRRSELRKVDLKSGKVQQRQPLGPKLFGEGIVVRGNDVVQLTWKSGIGLVYDKQTFKLRGTFRYAGEGWGITEDGESLIISDGSPRLRFLDPKTYRVTRRVTVRSRGGPIGKLNELEYIDGEIYANVWGSDYIARISPRTGEILGWIDLSGLLKRHERPHPDAVLNGIAFDKSAKRLFVTGKHWPKLFEIRLVLKKG